MARQNASTSARSSSLSHRGTDIPATKPCRPTGPGVASFEELAKEHQSLVAADIAGRFAGALGQAGLPDVLLARAWQSLEWAGCSERSAMPRTEASIQGGPLPTRLVGRGGPGPAAVLRARLCRWQRSESASWAPRQRAADT